MKAFLSVLEDSPMVLKPAISATSDTPEFSASDVVTRIREALFSLPDTRRGGNHQRYVIGDAGLRGCENIPRNLPVGLAGPV